MHILIFLDIQYFRKVEPELKQMKELIVFLVDTHILAFMPILTRALPAKNGLQLQKPCIYVEISVSIDGIK